MRWNWITAWLFRRTAQRNTLPRAQRRDDDLREALVWARAEMRKGVLIFLHAPLSPLERLRRIAAYVDEPLDEEDAPPELDPLASRVAAHRARNHAYGEMLDTTQQRALTPPLGARARAHRREQTGTLGRVP